MVSIEPGLRPPGPYSASGAKIEELGPGMGGGLLGGGARLE